MEKKKVWLVTGASKGLGLTLVRKLLKKGYRVAGTSRNLDALITEAGERSAQFLPLQVDLVDSMIVTDAISQVIKEFGTIDVVVNNAGYGQIGTLEELSDEEARKNFDINVFGSLNVIRAVMPHLRAGKSGAIFNISSIGGFYGNFPGWGIYCATKYAVAGLTESLSAEVKPFGITATVVYPGYFRTEFLSSDSLKMPADPIKEYTEARALEAKHVNEINDNQPGDPEKGAAALIEIAESGEIPLHLFLGQDAYDMARVKIDSIEKEMKVNEVIATATGF